MFVKDSLRKKIRDQRSTLSENKLNNLSTAIFNQWCNLQVTLKYSNIALYYPFKNEACTLRIMKSLHAKCKKVFLPKIQQNNLLIFAEYNDCTQLAKNQLGILEPQNSSYIKSEELDIVIMPCVGFNKQFYRLGMGGGYYDRTFAQDTSTIFIGLAYDFQFTNYSFQENHDIEMHYIITDKKIPNVILKKVFF